MTEPGPDVHARLARVTEYLERNGLFALTAEQVDQMAEVLDQVHDGSVFYDYYARRNVAQHAPGPGNVTDVTDTVRALEDAGLIEPGTDTGCDWQPTTPHRKE